MSFMNSQTTEGQKVASDDTPYVRVTEKTVGAMMQLKGVEFTCTGSATTNYDVSWDEDIEFVGARAKSWDPVTGEPSSNFGDKVHLQIIDKDNIIGYGAGLVITEFGKDIPGKMMEWGCIAETTTAAEMMKGLYLRIQYENTGSDDLVLVAAIRYYH